MCTGWSWSPAGVRVSGFAETVRASSQSTEESPDFHAAAPAETSHLSCTSPQSQVNSSYAVKRLPVEQETSLSFFTERESRTRSVTLWFVETYSQISCSRSLSLWLFFSLARAVLAERSRPEERKKGTADSPERFSTNPHLLG